MINNMDNKLISAYERLHKDYCYLEDQYDGLREQMILKDDYIRSLENKYSASIDQLNRIEKQLWVSQLEQECYKDEITKLKKMLQHNQ